MWTYLKENGHLRRYAQDSCSSTQECHVGSRKWRIKEGPITTTVEADPSPQPRQRERLISHHDRLEGFSANWSLTATCRRISTWRLISHHDTSFLPSDPPLRTVCWRTSLGLLPETCCFLPGLLYGFFLDPPGTWTLLLPKTGLAAPALRSWTIGTSCNGTTARSWWWLSPLYAILASFYLFYHSPSLPHHPNP